MRRRVLPCLALALAAAGSGRARAAGPGHGGGPGHVLAGPHGWRGGFHPGFRGHYWGYPGWYGPGFGVGLGWGWYGYPYYPYAYGPPVYVGPGYPPPPCGPPPPAAGAAPAAPAGPIRLTDTDVLLSIRVPPDAVVRINGQVTAQSGPRREFVSSGLARGRTYTFTVSARWKGPGGQAVEQERRVPVQGGERRTVDFFAPPPPAP